MGTVEPGVLPYVERIFEDIGRPFTQQAVEAVEGAGEGAGRVNAVYQAKYTSTMWGTFRLFYFRDLRCLRQHRLHTAAAAAAAAANAANAANANAACAEAAAYANANTNTVAVRQGAKLTETEVMERHAALAALAASESAATTMMCKSLLLVQLDTAKLAKQWDTWLEYLGEGTVETLENNPNLLLGEPSGPPGVTKAIAGFMGMFG